MSDKTLMGHDTGNGNSHDTSARSGGHGGRMSAREQAELLSKLQGIRTLPIVAMKVNDLINDPNSSSAQIADLLRKDQALTAKILKLVNSSYYSIPGGVTDVQRALAFLGFNTVAQLVLSVSVFSLFPKVETEHFSMTEFWRHALGVAVCSEALARKMKLPRPEEAFTCGLLHDVGKLALHDVDPSAFFDTIKEAKARGCSFSEIERERGLPEHTFIGESVAAHWGLPQNIRLSIRHHHADTADISGAETIPQSVKPLIAIVRIANAICIKAHVGRSGDYSAGDITPEMLSVVKLSYSDLPKIEAQLHVDMEKAGAFLNV